MDEPLLGEKQESLTLSQLASSESSACVVHITQLDRLSGYIVRGVQLQSASRTVEVYDGDDYIATCKGSLLETNGYVVCMLYTNVIYSTGPLGRSRCMIAIWSCLHQDITVT